MFKRVGSFTFGLRYGLLGFAAAVLLLVGSSATAHAACVASTPNTAAIDDAIGDITVAPDISRLEATTNASCGITVNPTIVGDVLPLGGAVSFYLDTDGNPATGDTALDGSDRLVITLDGFQPELFTWVDSLADFDFVNSVTLSLVGTAGFAATLDQLGVPSPGSIRMFAVSSDQNLTDADGAPDTGVFAFPVNLTQPPPPPPPPPPTPPAPPAPAANQQAKKSGCVVPKVKRLSVAKAKKKLKKAGCKYKIRGKGRVKSTSPSAGSRTTKTVIVRAKKKRARK